MRLTYIVPYGQDAMRDIQDAGWKKLQQHILMQFAEKEIVMIPTKTGFVNAIEFRISTENGVVVILETEDESEGL